MKKLLITLGVVAATFIARADTNTTGIGSWFDINRDELSQTNWAVVLAPSYAPGLKNASGESKEWGAAVALLHPVGTPYVLAGPRFDYLAGDLFKGDVNVTLQLPIKIAGTFTVTPLITSGASIIISGAGSKDGEIGANYGAGIKARFWENSKKNLAVGGIFQAEKWTQFSGIVIYHGGVAVSWNPTFW